MVSRRRPRRHHRPVARRPGQRLQRPRRGRRSLRRRLGGRHRRPAVRRRPPVPSARRVRRLDTVPCGLSGNPVRLGWEYGEPVHNSCYIVNDPANRVSQFFVIFHEVGHNFTCAAGAFATLVNASPDYGFPIDDAAWPTLLACAQQKISARTFNQQAICEAVATLFADGFESGDTASWSATLP